MGEVQPEERREGRVLLFCFRERPIMEQGRESLDGLEGGHQVCAGVIGVEGAGEKVEDAPLPSSKRGRDIGSGARHEVEETTEEDGGKGWGHRGREGGGEEEGLHHGDETVDVPGGEVKEISEGVGRDTKQQVNGIPKTHFGGGRVEGAEAEDEDDVTDRKAAWS